MASLNKVLLIGNLTRDPEMRYTPQGTAVATLRLAVNRRFKNKNTGENKDETCFINVVVWNKQAEVCNQYLSKGRPIFVEGRLQSRSWEDNQGQKRSVIEVIAERIQFLGSPQSQGAVQENQQEDTANKPEAVSSDTTAHPDNITDEFGENME